MEHYDVIVIGSGPAGEGAAMMATKSGKNVAVIERHNEVGGGCTHWGTIPSKALRHAVKTLRDARREPLLRSLRPALQIEFPRLLASANSVIETAGGESPPLLRSQSRAGVRRQRPGSSTSTRSRYARRPVTPERISAEHIVIATGSRPYHPPELDFSHPRVRDSDSVLHYDASPFAVTIFGAGVIGCEYASIFLNLGCKVTLVNTQERLLSFLDDEIAEALSYHLHEQGCVIRHNEQFAGLEPRADDVVLQLESGRRIKSDLLLWANGRVGNSDGMNLEAVGHRAGDSRGQIADQRALPDLAIAHLRGRRSGGPAGPGQRRLRAGLPRRAAHDRTRNIRPLRLDLVPSGIYTLPEISSVGLTERELLAQKIPYEVGHTSFKSLARAQMTDEKIGMLKLLFHTETLQVLGVHCFGDGAAEIVHIGQTVMASNDLNNMRYFTNATFNYPTMAEAYRTAAYNGLNRLT